VHSKKEASGAPRHIIPLTVNTVQYTSKREPLTTRDHYVISTGFGNDDDVAAAVSKEAIQYKQCLVPYVAVSKPIL